MFFSSIKVFKNKIKQVLKNKFSKSIVIINTKFYILYLMKCSINWIITDIFYKCLFNIELNSK